MKFTCLSFYAAVLAKDSPRKVPPRSPEQRFDTLNRFIHEWITNNIDLAFNRPERASRMKASFDRLYTKHLIAYERCGHFDSSLPHGGPPPEFQHLIRRRKRREAIENEDEEEVNLFDLYELSLQNPTLARSDAFSQLQRALSLDPHRALKQIQTGYRKWIERYLITCKTERNTSAHRDRLAKLAGNVRTAFLSLRQELRR